MSVMTRTPAFGLIGIHMVIVGIRLLHVYLDCESQHRLMSCMRMKTCMKMVAV